MKFKDGKDFDWVSLAVERPHDLTKVVLSLGPGSLNLGAIIRTIDYTGKTVFLNGLEFKQKAVLWSKWKNKEVENAFLKTLDL